MAKYRKFLVALAGVCGVLATVLADGSIDATEALTLVASVLAAFGVFRVPNEQV